MSADILGILKEYSIRYWVDGNNVKKGWVNIKCPMPNCDDHSNHGGFNPSGEYYNCWKCGHHNIETVLKYTLNKTKKEINSILLEYAGRGGLLGALNNKRKSTVAELVLPGRELAKMHKVYLHKRGFNCQYLVDKYGITGTGIAGDWKYRIIIPIIYKGKLVSYQGRDVTGKAKYRYKTLEPDKSVVNPKNILYNLDNCTKDYIFVAEGVFDVWRMGDDFCATLGTSMTDYQLKLLASYKQIVFVFDPEPEAQARAKKYAYKLCSMGCQVDIIDFEKDKDMADMERTQVISLLEGVLEKKNAS